MQFYNKQCSHPFMYNKFNCKKKLKSLKKINKNLCVIILYIFIPMSQFIFIKKQEKVLFSFAKMRTTVIT